MIFAFSLFQKLSWPLPQTNKGTQVGGSDSDHKSPILPTWVGVLTRSPSLSHPLFGWEGSPSKIDYRQNQVSTRILTSPLGDLADLQLFTFSTGDPISPQKRRNRDMDRLDSPDGCSTQRIEATAGMGMAMPGMGMPGPHRSRVLSLRRVATSNSPPQEPPFPYVNFQLVRNMFYFPLLVLKGIYHYWNMCFLFPGDLKGEKGKPAFVWEGSDRKILQGNGAPFWDSM